MVVERRNFQRVYDLTTRVLPEWDDSLHLIDQAQAEAQMLANSARSLGIFRSAWLADYYRLRNVAIGPLLQAWQEEGVVVPVDVETLGPMWLHHALLPLLERAVAGKLTATHSAVLSPFDPVVWDRRRAEDFFNFSYRLECYTPAPKRKYGYFVLPLLHKGALVGRMDAKMHRLQGSLEVIALYAEEGVSFTAGVIAGLRQAIADFAAWQGATRVIFRQLPAPLAQAWGEGWEIDPAPETHVISSKD